MRIDLLTREYPPHVYGGAGVHVTELSRVLAQHADIHVRAFDGPRAPAENNDVPAGVALQGYDYLTELEGANAAVRTMGVDLAMVTDVEGADLVHSHTWYANFAGHIASILYGIPHVISAHSLEPLRPWKREQLGGGYHLSSWVEKTAYESAAGIVAVSHAMRSDILRCYPNIAPERVRVIHNGIDLNAWKAPETTAEKEDARRYFASYGLDPDQPTIMFVGRITRQKGVPGLLRALRQVDKGIQVVLCAGAPDTPEILEETKELVAELQAEREGVVWIDDMLSQDRIVALESCCTTFVTPSIYEPLGIVNLEAMAVGLPVVGTETGGIPDCIVHGATGLLVPIEQAQDGTGTPLNPEQFEADLAEALNEVCSDPERAAQMGAAGRRRVEDHFSWEAIGEKTMEFYRELVDNYPRR
ncbi:glycogen synthase [Actinotignum schaalii]|uniref:glycogen synthase n=1 Tax=Actinotignum TaxID=1653174 RepID=UPI00237DE8CA|nr:MULTISPECIES: glycogen synthase [Actinotignum]MDE1553328.1 glycogen synthase [Actinotignum sanguinis]MDE1566037.1 glycogen synthase [Actinotignum sanguinis]MDE1577050.1 glycogen synthase [Actinotignum sanguinis]MDE1642485.1 glycogen synthase [Actinotignum sanguinis]MDE1654419.1 glycogen synthase [Actinotignum schaalii]